MEEKINNNIIKRSLGPETECYVAELSFSALTIIIQRIGEDYQITFWGGDTPHIGCSVLSVPRPSLTGDGTVSATTSVLNVVGHKDEMIARYLAEKVAAKKNAVVSCSGGFHVDGITKAQISEVMEALKQII